MGKEMSDLMNFLENLDFDDRAWEEIESDLTGELIDG